MTQREQTFHKVIENFKNVSIFFVVFGFFFLTCHIWNMREVLVSCRKIVADFLKGLFMAKKHDLSDKIFFVCHAPLPLPLQKFVSTLAQSL
jgi:hypothetical protein